MSAALKPVPGLVECLGTGNWTVKCGADTWYMFDDEVSSRPLFTGWKDRAHRFAFHEAETMAAGLRAIGYSVMVVSAGGEG